MFFRAVESQGIITSWSAGAERLLGYQEAEILGQPGSCIFTPEDLEQGEDKKEFSKALAEGRAENEHWHIRKDKSRFWGSGIVTPLRNEMGQLRGFCKIMRDFTDRNQAEDERNQLLAREQEARTIAEAANRLKDEFLTFEDGYSLIHKVRQLTAEQGGQIPAIAMTAYARDEDREQAISSGFQTHVSKPVEPDELAIAVANLLLSSSNF